MLAFPLCSSFTRMLVRRPADKKISGIAVLFQPDVNVRTKSAKRKGVVTSNNPREVIYPQEIWPQKEKETEKERICCGDTYGGPFWLLREQADKFIWMRPRVLVIPKIEFAVKFPSRFLGSTTSFLFFSFYQPRRERRNGINESRSMNRVASLKVRSLTIGRYDTRS